MTQKISRILAGLPFVALGFFMLVYPLLTTHATSITLVLAGGVLIFIGGYVIDPADTEAIVTQLTTTLAKFIGRHGGE